MESVEQSLLPKLAQVKKYLESKFEQNIAYQDLLTQIDDAIAELAELKPKIKLVSNVIDLSQRLKSISIKDLSLNQYYQFHLVPLDGLIENIVQDCEMILIVCDLHSLISLRDKQLIEAAIAQNIDLKVIIVNQADELIESPMAISHWLERQNSDFNPNFLWSEDNLLVLENANSLQHYHNFLKQNSSLANFKLQEKYTAKITRTVNHRIEKINKATWQAIKVEKNQRLEGNPPEVFRQKLNKLITQVNKLQQQQFQRIRQKIQHNRSCLNNPFLDNNLFWQTQQIIQDAEVKIVKVEQQEYLVGMVKAKNSLEPLHLYLTNIYQEQHFGTQEITPLTLDQPNFDLNSLIYIPILEQGSRIPFEYSFNQSQWFKIMVAGGVGIAIFLVTHLFSGQGRFFGFFILIFQFINLFTGQDVKTLRIKQQTKELKRKLDIKYQILIRLSVEKITQDLIVVLDNEQQYYQQQIDAIAQTLNERISTIKEQIEQQREQINMRKQDLVKILQLLE